MATYTGQSVGSAGLAATYNAAGVGGDRVPPNCILHVKNANASPANVTLVTPHVHEGDLAVSDRVVAVPATNGERFIRVPSDQIYQADDGLVDVTWSVTTSVTFAVLVR